MSISTFVFIFRSCQDEHIRKENTASTVANTQIRITDLSGYDRTKLLSDSTSFIPSADLKVLIDSLNVRILSKQNEILQKQSDLVNDIRQETNNNLDKHSAWLAFWITILSIIGVVCPIAYNSWNSRKLDENIRKQEKDLKRIQGSYSLKMQVMSFDSVCANNHLEEGSGNARRLYINSVKRHFNQYLSNIDDSEGSWEEEQVHLYSVLVNLEAFLMKCRKTGEFEENRRIKDVEDLVKLSLPKIAKSAFFDDDLKKQIQKIKFNLDKI